MNSLYGSAREKFLTGQLNWLDGVFRIVMCDTSYYVDIDTHEFLSSIPVGNRVNLPQALTNRSAVSGYAKADSVQFPALFDTRTVKSLVIYRVGTTDADSDLVAYLDDAAGLPFQPTGLVYTVNWSAGLGIFRL